MQKLRSGKQDAQKCHPRDRLPNRDKHRATVAFEAQRASACCRSCAPLLVALIV